MKLLALRLCEHDSNFCFFDGAKIRYSKLERIKGVKHFSYNDLHAWRNDFENIFNEKIDNIDEIAIIIDPWVYNLPDSFFSTAINFKYLNVKPKVWRINHHYAHSLSSWMMTDETIDLAFVFDGFGDLNQSWSIFKNDNIIDYGLVDANGSIGIEMAQAGRFLGIEAKHDIDIAGKLMGLQTYGNLSSDFLEHLKDQDLKNIKEIFSYRNWMSFINNDELAYYKRIDWIRTVHEKVGQSLLNLMKKYADEDDVISFTGGVAQNVIWNSLLKEHFKNIIIPPHCADDGLTLGAIEWLRIKNNLDKFNIKDFPFIQTDEAPKDAPTEETINYTAELLANKKVVGWYQGHGELGPRALGNRSILMDPRIKNGKETINRVKNREHYRPFGATILEDFKSAYFDGYCDSNMLYVAKAKNNLDFPAITHIDGSCRLQILNNENILLRKLLTKFYNLTGCPVILNTSMNYGGKPIAGSIKDAEILFKNTEIDAMIIGNTILEK